MNSAAAQETPRRRPRGSLSRDRILDAARVLVADRGLEALTIRALALELGVPPMTIYGQFRSKEQLLDALAALAVDSIDIPPAGGSDWQQWLRTAMAALRAALLGASSLVPLLVRRPLVFGGTVRGPEAMLEVLSQAGLSEQEVVRAYRLLTGYVIASVQTEATRGTGLPTPEERERLRAELEFRYRVLPASTNPRLVQLAPLLARFDPDAEFAYGLDLILDGLARRSDAS